MAMMSDIVDQVRDYLDQNDWKYEYIADRNYIRAGVNLNCKLQSVKLLITFNEKGYTVLAVANMNASEDTRKDVLEYISRANYGLRNGNFEMDLNDGEVRFKTYTNCKGMDRISNEIIEDSIIIPPMMFSRYGDGMAALMFGFSDPETEIKKVENA